MLFVLAVLFISLLTDGYVYGIIASMAAVIGVNYIFTYPYFALNFTITGYPMTFLTMLAVFRHVYCADRHGDQLLEGEAGERGQIIREMAFP